MSRQRADAGETSFDIWSYNTGPSRPDRQVADEIRAILSTGPGVLGLNEVVGNRLPDVDGYQLLRDTSSRSRANVAAYVRDDLPVTHVRWDDLHQTWTGPKTGTRHDPRSFLSFHAARIPVTIAHQAPRWTDNEYPAQWEGLDTLTRRLAPWTAKRAWAKKRPKARRVARRRPRLALGDMNRTGRDTGPSPAILAQRIGGRLVEPRRIDTAVVRHATGSQVRLVRKVAGIKLGTDHPGALRFTLTVPTRWTRPKEKKTR